MRENEYIKLKSDQNYSENRNRITKLNIDLDPKDIYKGIVLSQILGKPRSKNRKIR